MPELERDTKVLVSGASGFLASHCVRVLLEQGYKVRGTVRSLSDAKKVAPLYELAPSAKTDLELVEADLLKPESWKEAVKGCTYVLHVASPCPLVEPSDEQVLIKPAVEGTLSVLKACTGTSVKRVVLTSSVASIAGQDTPDFRKTYTEKDWSDLTQKISAYSKSKTLAEKAAWNYLENQPTDSSKIEMATINPTYIMGPICHGSVGSSQELVGRLMRREMPALPHMAMEMCDVRDVALAHVRAMTLPEAAGQRFIVNTDSIWLKEASDMLNREFGPQGYRVPTMSLPRFLASVVSIWDKTLAFIMPRWGETVHYDNSKMREILKIQPTDREKTLLDMAYSMIDNGLIPKTSKYKPRQSGKV